MHYIVFASFTPSVLVIRTQGSDNYVCLYSPSPHHLHLAYTHRWLLRAAYSETWQLRRLGLLRLVAVSLVADVGYSLTPYLTRPLTIFQGNLGVKITHSVLVDIMSYIAPKRRCREKALLMLT